MVDAVIFDLDDTLYPEIEFVKSGFHRTASYLAELVNQPDEMIFQDIWTEFKKDSKYVFNRILESYGIFSCDLLNSLIEEYRLHKPSIQLSEQNEEFLQWLPREGFKTGIITDGYMDTQKNKVEALGLKDMVNSIIYTDSLGRHNWKPSTMAFEVMLKEFKCPPEKAVYVGDNPQKDFIPGNVLGMITVHLISHTGIYSKVSNIGLQNRAKYSVKQLWDIERIIKV